MEQRMTLSTSGTGTQGTEGAAVPASSKSYGRRGIKDRLTPVLEKIPEADTFIAGSPLFRDRYPGDAILH